MIVTSAVADFYTEGWVDLLKKVCKHFSGQDFSPFDEVRGGPEAGEEEHALGGESPVAIGPLATEVPVRRESSPLLPEDRKELSGL